MASTLETLVVRLTADATKLEQELNQQVRKSETAGQKIGRAFSTAARAAVGLGTAAAGVATALTVAANRAAGYADEVDKAAIRTRLAKTTVQELRFVADQAGGSFQAIEQNIRAFTGRIAEAERGSKTLEGTFDRLGVALKDSNGNLRDTESLFLDTLNALSKVENETERAALAVSAFGETGTELLPIISQGAGGIDELRQKARDLGIVLDDQSVKTLVAYKDQLSRVQQQFGAIQRELATALLPVLTDKLLPAIERGLEIFRGLPEPLQRAAGAATALGTGFTAAAAGARLLGLSLAPLLGPTGLLVAGGLLAVTAFAAAMSGDENSIEAAAERAAKAVGDGNKNSLKGALSDLQGYLDGELSSSIQGVIDLLNTMALSAVGTRVLMEVSAAQAATLARVAEIDAEIERLRNPSRFEVMLGERTGITPDAKIAELVAERNQLLAAVQESTDLAMALAEARVGIFEGATAIGGGSNPPPGGGAGGPDAVALTNPAFARINPFGPIFQQYRDYLDEELEREIARFQGGLLGPNVRRRRLSLSPFATVNGAVPLGDPGVRATFGGVTDLRGFTPRATVGGAVRLDDPGAFARLLLGDAELQERDLGRLAQAQKEANEAAAEAARLAIAAEEAWRNSVLFARGQDARFGTPEARDAYTRQAMIKSGLPVPTRLEDLTPEQRALGASYRGFTPRQDNPADLAEAQRILDERERAEQRFAETVAGAAFSFTENLIGAIRSGDIGEAFRAALGAGQSILGSASLGSLPFLGGSLGIGALLSGVLGIFAALIPRGAGESEATRALGASTRGAPAVELNFTVNQSLNIASLTGSDRRAVDGLLNDTVRALDGVITRNILPRLGYLEERIA